MHGMPSCYFMPRCDAAHSQMTQVPAGASSLWLSAGRRLPMPRFSEASSLRCLRPACRAKRARQLHGAMAPTHGGRRGCVLTRLIRDLQV